MVLSAIAEALSGDVYRAPRVDEDGHVRLRRKVFIALAVMLTVWLAAGGRVLVRTQMPVAADAVVVPSGDPHGERLRAAFEVYESTGSARLVVFRSGAQALYSSEEELRTWLDERDVEGRVLEPGESTAEEAGLFAGLAARCGWDTVVLVTSAYQTSRAARLFERALGGGVVLRVVVGGEPFHPGAWFLHGDEIDRVVAEWAKWLPSLLSSPDPVDPGGPC